MNNLPYGGIDIFDQTACQFTDINISATGEIALGTRFGEILLTDTGFSSVSKFNVGTASTFVAFASDAAIPNSTPTLVIQSPEDGAAFTEDVEDYTVQIEE